MSSLAELAHNWHTESSAKIVLWIFEADHVEHAGLIDQYYKTYRLRVQEPRQVVNETLLVGRIIEGMRVCSHPFKPSRHLALRLDRG